ncbi:hypothetical protein FGO68_gene12513 [Halteria grandinella]|uniref:Uncharacterized protein n=1 Tax=Halteria grandinella TaxID=5974 RepID=A0A8J8NLH2_HALGN|nr:hypothetical protein FGO68_gene12513 [Halteria grandinella]
MSEEASPALVEAHAQLVALVQERQASILHHKHLEEQLEKAKRGELPYRELKKLKPYLTHCQKPQLMGAAACAQEDVVMKPPEELSEDQFISSLAHLKSPSESDRCFSLLKSYIADDNWFDNTKQISLIFAYLAKHSLIPPPPVAEPYLNLFVSTQFFFSLDTTIAFLNLLLSHRDTLCHLSLQPKTLDKLHNLLETECITGDKERLMFELSLLKLDTVVKEQIHLQQVFTHIPGYLGVTNSQRCDQVLQYFKGALQRALVQLQTVTKGKRKQERLMKELQSCAEDALSKAGLKAVCKKWNSGIQEVFLMIANAKNDSGSVSSSISIAPSVIEISMLNV